MCFSEMRHVYASILLVFCFATVFSLQLHHGIEPIYVQNILMNNRGLRSCKGREAKIQPEIQTITIEVLKELLPCYKVFKSLHKLNLLPVEKSIDGWSLPYEEESVPECENAWIVESFEIRVNNSGSQFYAIELSCRSSIPETLVQPKQRFFRDDDDEENDQTETKSTTGEDDLITPTTKKIVKNDSTNDTTSMIAISGTVIFASSLVAYILGILTGIFCCKKKSSDESDETEGGGNGKKKKKKKNKTDGKDSKNPSPETGAPATADGKNIVSYFKDPILDA